MKFNLISAFVSIVITIFPLYCFKFVNKYITDNVDDKIIHVHDNDNIVCEGVKKKTIWIIVNDSDYAFSASVTKVQEQLHELWCPIDETILIVEAVCENDLMMKIDADGLSIYHKGEKQKCPDVIWCRINSELLQVDQHVTLLRHLEMMGAKIVNSIEGIMKCTNKVWHLQELAKAGIPTPATLTMTSKDTSKFENVSDTLNYPIVMKTVRGNGGKGVFMVPSDEIRKELNGVLKTKLPYLFQEYIHESHGKDLRVIVVDGVAVFSMIRYSGDGTMRANLSQGGHGEVVTGVHPYAEHIAINIANLLKLDICGVDLLISERFGYVCCEVNNSPGFTREIYDASDIAGPIAKSLLKYIY
jgi:RimK family alpha-L-glutamate ligase